VTRKIKKLDRSVWRTSRGELMFLLTRYKSKNFLYKIIIFMLMEKWVLYPITSWKKKLWIVPGQPSISIGKSNYTRHLNAPRLFSLLLRIVFVLPRVAYFSCIGWLYWFFTRESCWLFFSLSLS